MFLHAPQGIALLALGAGVGEETFFRGFLQTATVSSLADWGSGVLSQQAATVLGVAAVSLFFGALHAATRLYFVFATVAGALFGASFLVHREANIKPSLCAMNLSCCFQPGTIGVAGVLHGVHTTKTLPSGCIVVAS